MRTCLLTLVVHSHQGVFGLLFGGYLFCQMLIGLFSVYRSRRNGCQSEGAAEQIETLVQLEHIVTACDAAQHSESVKAQHAAGLDNRKAAHGKVVHHIGGFGSGDTLTQSHVSDEQSVVRHQLSVERHLLGRRRQPMVDIVEHRRRLLGDERPEIRNDHAFMVV